MVLESHRDITAAEVVSELVAAFPGQQGVKGAFNLSEGKIVSPQVLGGRNLMLTICSNYHIKVKHETDSRPWQHMDVVKDHHPFLQG